MPKVLAIVGPTGVGKSEVAQRVAESLGGEIISADSMQVYRRLNIGTGKVPLAERRVAHHCLDIVEIGQPYSAAEYQRDARAAIESCFARSAMPIICGGTGLYVRAALEAMEFVDGSQSENEVRARLEQELADRGAEWMWRRLMEVDPACESVLHPNNSVRVVRALEMAERGTLYSDQVAGFRSQSDQYDTLYVGLTMDRAELYRTIEGRIDSMLAAGWLEEVSALEAEGYGDSLIATAPIGYPELVEVVRGTQSLDDAVESIKTGTRRYAKRQLTWFRPDSRIHWIDRTDMTTHSVAEQVVRLMTGLE